MLPRCTFITAFIIQGSNPFVKYSHLKPICINKGPFLKEHAHSKKIRFYLVIHTTPKFSSCSQAVQNIYFQMCPTVVLSHFPPSLRRANKLLGTRVSLSTPVHYIYQGKTLADTCSCLASVSTRSNNRIFTLCCCHQRKVLNKWFARPFFI